ncbi:3-deoxy-D-manno-octulosonic acid transferase [Gemmatimonadota bacterium]
MSRGRVSTLSASLLLGFYHLFSYLIAGATFPFWLIRDGRAGGGLSQRYGAVPRDIRQKTDRFGCIWMHAASVGEVAVLTRVLPHLVSQTPELPVVVTTMTSTGRDRTRQLLRGQADHLYLPLDAPAFVNRTIKQLHPKVLIIAETELWPNLIRKVARYGAPIVMVNAKLSARASRRYRWVGSGMKRILNDISVICVKSETDRERFVALGAEPGRVVVTGDLKYEPLPGVVDTPIDGRRHGLGLPTGRPVFTAGSTRQGEEAMVLDAFERATRQVDDLLMIVAPRYPKRADEVFELITARGVQCLRRTELLEGASAEGIEVLLLDTIGELERFFAASDLAFVGGSLVPVGGHNLLEPAMYGVPILFGPFTDETAGADSLLLESSGGMRVADGQSLGDAIASLIGDTSMRLAMGESARKAVRRGRGALDGVIEHYRRALGVGTSEVRATRTDRGSRGPRADDIVIGIEADSGGDEFDADAVGDGNTRDVQDGN